jgi:hypothetical protein
MTTQLRRLLNHLPLPHGSSEIYVRSTWHRPTLFDQCVSRPPFRMASFNSHHGGRLRLQQLFRRILRWGVAGGVAWLVLESIRGLALL